MKQKHCRRARRDLAMKTWDSISMVSFKEHWLKFNEDHHKLQKELLNQAKRQVNR